jgi:glycine/D-amino acid oxidase-like deaminating enzyme
MARNSYYSRPLSFWQKDTFFKYTDVLIVGAGLVGLWLTLWLKTKKPGIKIRILDKEDMPDGASVRNAGFACFGSPSELIADLKRSEQNMWDTVAMRYEGIRTIRQILGDTGVNYDNCGGYELFESEKALREVMGNLDTINLEMSKITKECPVFSRSGTEKLNSFGFKGFVGTIENSLEGGLHPGNMVKELTKKVRFSGVEMVPSAKVIRYDEDGSMGHVVTEKGYTFSAKHVFFCTNAWSSELFPDCGIEPGRGQVLLTSPIPSLRWRGTFHIEEGYYYLRNWEGRVLIGGGRNLDFPGEKTTKLQTTELIQAELERRLEENIIPGVEFEITDRWPGIMAFNESRTPTVYEKGARAKIILSCNGMGVSLSPIFTKRIAEKFEF